MTYYRKQRMESFKRAMFADLLNNQNSRDESAGADASRDEQESWYFQPSSYAAAGSSGLAS